MVSYKDLKTCLFRGFLIKVKVCLFLSCLLDASGPSLRRRALGGGLPFDFGHPPPSLQFTPSFMNNLYVAKLVDYIYVKPTGRGYPMGFK